MDQIFAIYQWLARHLNQALERKSRLQILTLNSFWVPAILYVVIATPIIKFYRYQISPDSTSYISLAQKYLQGDFANAINGCWSPLYTWLLIPLMAVGIEPLLAGVMITFTFGLGILAGFWILTKRLEFPPFMTAIVTVGLIPVILAFAVKDSPPDFLLVCFLLSYLATLIHPKFGRKKTLGLLCGVWAALAYYSKAYALPFFAAHFSMICGLYYTGVDISVRPGIRRNFLYGMALFVLLTSGWITLISIKYDTFTFSTAGKFNQLAVGPDSKSTGGPYYYQGLFPPPNETAMSGWEDPSLHTMPEWSPFESRRSFIYQLRLIWKNALKTKQRFESFSVLSSLILVGFISMAFVAQEKTELGFRGFALLVTMLIYCFGYILIVVETRYLWFNAFLLVLMGCYVLNVLFDRFFNDFETWHRVLQWVMVICMISTFALPSVRALKTEANTKEDVYLLGKHLLKEFNLTGNIAANSHNVSLYLCYHLGAKYYGQIARDISADELRAEMLKYDIDYYFVWDEGPDHPKYLQNFKELTQGEIHGLRIYAMKSRTNATKSLSIKSGENDRTLGRL